MIYPALGLLILAALWWLFAAGIKQLAKGQGESLEQANQQKQDQAVAELYLTKY